MNVDKIGNLLAFVLLLAGGALFFLNIYSNDATQTVPVISRSEQIAQLTRQVEELDAAKASILAEKSTAEAALADLKAQLEAATSAAAQTESTLQEKSASVAELSASLDQARQDLDAKSAEAAKVPMLAEQLQKAKAAADQIQSELSAAQQKVTDLQSQISDREKRIAELEKSLDDALAPQITETPEVLDGMANGSSPQALAPPTGEQAAPTRQKVRIEDEVNQRVGKSKPAVKPTEAVSQTPSVPAKAQTSRQPQAQKPSDAELRRELDEILTTW